MNSSPFRIVDEINQGMDERNERLVFDRVVQSCCGSGDKPQYFLVSPKLLQGLRAMQDDDITVLLVFNGPGVADKWHLGSILGDISTAAHTAAGGAGASSHGRRGGGIKVEKGDTSVDQKPKMAAARRAVGGGRPVGGLGYDDSADADGNGDDDDDWGARKQGGAGDMSSMSTSTSARAAKTVRGSGYDDPSLGAAPNRKQQRKI